MASSRRIRRPAASRTAPVRAFSELLDQRAIEAADEPDAEPELENADEQAAEGEQGNVGDAGTSGDAGATDDAARSASPIRNAVELGYRVIDGYLAQGRRFAEEIGGATAGLGRRPGRPQEPSDLRDIADRLARDWLLLFTRLADTFAASGVGDPAARNAERPVAGTTKHVSVEIDSRAPARVTLDLGDRTISGALRVQSLRSLDDDIPPIRDISLSGDGAAHPLIARIRIPDDQPPGLYSGVVIEEGVEHPCGTLSVQLGESR